ncbi:MAG: peptidase [Calditrichaeota bacterium]|nr:MAG: peptidase [Calditrichota bacterium]
MRQKRRNAWWYLGGVVMMVFLFLVLGCGKKQTWTVEEAQEIAQRMKKYAPTPMNYDLSSYPERDRELLKTLIEVGKLADEIFWRQTYHRNIELREQIVKKRSEDDPVRRFFFMQAGPFDRLAHNEPFMDVPPKPPGAGFYPPDMTKEEFENWIETHPEDKEAFLSPYTVIRREGDRLVAVPYHEAYKEFIDPMAEKLRHAATLTDNESFRRYLLAKADALQTDQYFDADVAWIDMKDSPYDMVIGPFEVYEDELNNLKAAYEASVEIVDREESARLEVYKQHLEDLEKFLPYPEEYKNPRAGLTASFVIVRDIYRGGDIRVGYQPVAANLPNDPEVQAKKGTKKTFWKNVLEARLNQIILPIGKRLIASDQVQYMTPQGFFDFVLMHEIAHGIGPRYVHGTKTPVNVALRELYSWIEENKADLAGLHSLRYFRENDIIDPAMRRQHLVSYLGSIFRTIRFGTGEAHGKAALVSFNFLRDHGGIVFDEATGRYSIDFSKIDQAITLLTNELLMIEAEGDYARAQRLEAHYGQMPEFLKQSLQQLEDLPIDIVPEYKVKWE